MRTRKYYFNSVDQFHQPWGEKVTVATRHGTKEIDEYEVWTGLGKQLLSVVISGTDEDNLVGLGGMVVAMFFSDALDEDGETIVLVGEEVGEESNLATGYEMSGPITSDEYKEVRRQAKEIMDSASKDDLYITYRTFKKKYFTE